MVLLVILSLVVIFIFTCVFIPTVSMKNNVLDYLIEEKGYSKSYIKRMNRWFFGLPRYGILVVFKNEPHIEYMYMLTPTDNGWSVQQLMYRTSNYGKIRGLSDFKEEDLLHYDDSWLYDYPYRR